MSMEVFVLNHRLELAENSNQTECVDPYLFEDLNDAIAKARAIMRETAYAFGWNNSNVDDEAKHLEKSLKALSENGSSAHLVQLTDSDNEVFELSRQPVNERSSR